MKRILCLLLVFVTLSALMPVMTFAKSILVYENFDGFELGETDISNRYVKIGGTPGTHFSIARPQGASSKAVKIENNGPEAGAGTSANITLEAGSTKGKLTFSMKYMLTAFHPAASVKIYDTISRKTVSILSINGGNVVPMTGNNNTQLMNYAQPIDPNTWFEIKLCIDTDAKVYDFWFNGELAAEDIQIPLCEEFYNNGITTFIIQRQSGKEETAVSYADDILLFSGEEESEIEKPVMKDDGKGIELRFSPRDKQICTQNPPCFNWPAISQSEGYRLQLSRDADMANVVYDIENIEKNFYLFSHTLETGVWYYRVKGTNINGESDWSMIRRFRIREDAIPFPVPSTEDMMAMIPEAHPRIWVNNDTMDEFRAKKNIPEANEFYEELKKRVDEALDNDLPGNPDDMFSFPPGISADEKNNIKSDLRTYCDGQVNEMRDAAFMYLITGEEKYGKKAAAFLDRISDWDVQGMTNYNVHDQVHEYTAYVSSLTFDWIYDFLSAETKKKALANIEERLTYMFKLFMTDYPLWELPYDSHKSSQAQKFLVESMALMHDLPIASYWFEELFPVCVGVLPPWGGEDGGYAGGTAYASFGQTVTFGMCLDAIETATGFKIFDKAIERNRKNYFMYFTASGSPFGSFGDEVYNVSWVDSTVTNAHLMYATIYDDPHAQWAAETRGVQPYASEIITYKYFNDIEAVPPFTKMNSYYDRDIGWVMFMSDFVDTKRVGINFKSSIYGAYNHTHADNNTFNIYAYGEPLAVDSGYYDYYGSTHWDGYSNQTVAHNGITVNNGHGQYFRLTDEIGCMNSKGEISGYIPGDIFNITSGDAKEAYAEYFDIANRHLIYLKPDYLVVVDELETKNDEKMQMEFNLHFRSQPEVFVDNMEAITTQGEAKLISTMRYPEMKDIKQIDRYLGVDGIEYRPVTRHTNKKNQYAIRFETEETDETVMVSTFDILKADEKRKNVKTEQNDKVMKITAEGKEVYVRLDHKAGEVSFSGVTFDGVAAVIDGENYALVNGTKLVKDGVTLVSSDNTGSFSYEGGEVHTSTDDAKISMYVPKKINSIADETGYAIPSSDSDEYSYAKHPFKWTQKENILEITAESGTHNMYFNGIDVVKYDNRTVRINSTPVEYKNEPYSVNGNLFVPLLETAKAYKAKVSENNGIYTIEKTSDFYNGYTYLGNKTRVIELKEGSDKVKVDGEEKNMSYAPELKNGVLYIPLRGYFELFTDRIGWSDYAKTAYVYTESKYHDDYTCSIWPRIDIMTEQEQFETDNKVLSVFNSGKGTVEYNKVFAVGEEVTFKAEPEDGWYISKVTFNDEELKVTDPAGFEYTVAIPHKLSVFYVYFSKYEDGKAVVSSYPEMAREGSDLYYFSRVKNLEADASEYGILISSVNENPIPGEYGTEKVKSDFAPNERGMLGFKILTSSLENG